MASHGGRDAHHTISMLFTFTLVALFAIMMLLMVVISAQGYKKTIESGEHTAGFRTALGYVQGKVLSGAARDGMRVEHVDGVDVLFLQMITEYDELFETAIYCYDGMLMELGYLPDDLDFHLEYGNEMIEMDEFTAAIDREAGLLIITERSVNGKGQSLRIALGAAGEVDP